jgi:hypothetical protein
MMLGDWCAVPIGNEYRNQLALRLVDFLPKDALSSPKMADGLILRQLRVHFELVCHERNDAANS